MITEKKRSRSEKNGLVGLLTSIYFLLSTFQIASKDFDFNFNFHFNFNFYFNFNFNFNFDFLPAFSSTST